MLLRLLFFRLGPLISLKICKERKNVKAMLYLFLLIHGLGLIISFFCIVYRERWKSVFYIPLSMFPHYIFYGFASWMLLRCIISAWSERVWRRIYSLSVVGVLLGILTEFYWNPRILNFFVKKF